MRVGEQEGMQHFDGDIERLIREGILDMETGLAYATNPGNLQLDMSDLKLDAEAEAEADPLLETSDK
jgi:twitching motility protein PilT